MAHAWCQYFDKKQGIHVNFLTIFTITLLCQFFDSKLFNKNNDLYYFVNLLLVSCQLIDTKNVNILTISHLLHWRSISPCQNFDISVIVESHSYIDNDYHLYINLIDTYYQNK